jgi:hypothetical protein
MSASEQEIKSQIAEMRQALRSAAASRRAARVVNMLGVLVGFCIVLFIVISIVNMGKDLVNRPQDLQKAFRQQIDALQLDRKATEVLDAAAPAYINEATQLVKDLQLPEKLFAEAKIMVVDLTPVLQQELNRLRPRLTAMVNDIEPVLRDQLDRIRPRVIAMLTAQQRRTVADLTKILQERVDNRFREIIARQGQRLQQGTDLNEEQLALYIENLRNAATDALTDMLQARAGNLEQELTNYVGLVAQIKPMKEPAEQTQLVGELISVLVALLKYNLPDYAVTAAMIGMPLHPVSVIPAGPPVPGVTPGIVAPQLQLSPEARKKVEEERKAEAEARAKAEEAGKEGVR